jgi:RNA polymerase sigma-70 factor (ECF subfamily)
VTARPPASVEEELAQEFDRFRPLLVGAAYRVLGSVTDAEDVVQEAWLRWSAADRSQVREPRAYLLSTTSRLALNRVRSQASRREAYVGPWLPEPVATDPHADVEATVEQADSVSMAMMVVLETLSPLERTAFVLHDVFAVPFGEIATTLDRSEAAVRQLAHRARSHVHARRPRHQVDARRHREVTERFFRAATQGDVDGLLEMLAPDVVLVSDGGGIKRAALHPIHGGDSVIRFLLGVLAKPESMALHLALATVNGQLAVVGTTDDGTVDSVGFLTVEDDGISAMYLVRNPEKLRRLSL